MKSKTVHSTSDGGGTQREMREGKFEAKSFRLRDFSFRAATLDFLTDSSNNFWSSGGVLAEMMNHECSPKAYVGDKG